MRSAILAAVLVAFCATARAAGPSTSFTPGAWIASAAIEDAVGGLTLPPAAPSPTASGDFGTLSVDLDAAWSAALRVGCDECDTMVWRQTDPVAELSTLNFTLTFTYRF